MNRFRGYLKVIRGKLKELKGKIGCVRRVPVSLSPTLLYPPLTSLRDFLSVVGRWGRKRFLFWLHRPSRREIALALAFSMILQLSSPIVLFWHKPKLIANSYIRTDEEGEAIFVNENPDFKVEFGDKEEPSEHKVRFEVDAVAAGASPAKEGILKAVPGWLYQPKKPLGIEFSFLEATASAAEENRALKGATSPEVATFTSRSGNRSLKAATSESEVASFSEDGEVASFSSRDEKSPAFDGVESLTLESSPEPAEEKSPDSGSGESGADELTPDRQKVLTEFQKEAEQIKEESAKLAEKAKRILGEAEQLRDEIAKEAKKPVLLEKPDMDADPQKFANSHKFAEPSDSKAIRTDSHGTLDTVSQLVDDTIKTEYQILPGEGLKESITIEEPPLLRHPEFISGSQSPEIPKQVRNDNESPANSFTFELKLDPGVQLKRSFESLVDTAGEKKSQALRSVPKPGFGESPAGEFGASGGESASGGTYYFTDEAGTYLFHFEPPFAVDAGGSKTSAVALEIQQNRHSEFSSESDTNKTLKQVQGDTNTYTLTVTVDEAWLSDPARVYPIIIDPTIVHQTSSQFSAGTYDRLSLRHSELVSESKVELTYPELACDEHTVGLWHMNSTSETEQNVEDACGSNDGTLGTDSSAASDDPRWVTNGRVGHTALNAMEFDGTDDYVSVADSTDWDIGTNFSISLWVKHDDHSGIEGYVTHYEDDNNYWHLGHTDGSGLRFFIASAAVGIVDTGYSGEITDTNWHHITLTKSGNDYKLYKDATEIDSVTDSDIDTFAGSLLMGVRESGFYYFDGLIDEVAIHNRALTPEEIAAHASRSPYGVYQSSVVDFGSTPHSLDSLSYKASGVQTGSGQAPFSTDGLVAQWNFDEANGTTAKNNAPSFSCGGTPSNCDGTLTLMTTTGQDDAAGDGWTKDNGRWPGSSPAALAFDGTDGYVTTADNAVWDFGDGNFTLETWFNTTKAIDTSADDVRRLVSAGTTAGNQLWTWGYGSHTTAWGGAGEKFNFAYYDGSYHDFNSNVTSIKPGNWYHAAIVRNGNTLYFYKNGEQVGSTSYTYTTNASGGVYIGARHDGTPATIEYHTGTIDAARVYKGRALGADEILANYQAGNIEFQTRTGATSDPNDGTWEAWKPTTSESQIESMDFDGYTADASTRGLYHLNNALTNDTSASCGATCDLTNNGTVAFNSTNYKLWGSHSAGPFGTGKSLSDAELFDLSISAGVVEAWFFPTSLSSPTTQYLWYSEDGGAGGDTYLSVNSSGALSLVVAGGTALTSANNVISANRWYHLAARWSGGTTYGQRIYVDGLLVASNSTGTSHTDTTTDFFLGNISATGAANYFNGYIDEVRLYVADRTDAEIAQDAQWAKDITNPHSGGIVAKGKASAPSMENSASQKYEVGAPQVDANTVALWHMDETSGTGAYIKDSSANANHGTPTGTTVVDGFYGKARSFNGTSDYVNVPSPSGGSLNPSSAITIEAWTKRNSSNPSGGSIIVGKMDTSTTRTYYLSFTNDQLQLEISENGQTTDRELVNSTTTITDKMWHYVVGTYSGGGSTKVYIDGVNVSGTPSGNAASINQNSSIVGIGKDVVDNIFFDGSIDEVRISNTARTAEEIAEAYRAGRDHRVTRGFVATDLSSKTKLPFWIASDRPGTFLEATVGESAYANYEPDANTVGLWHLEEETGTANTYIRDSSSQGNDSTTITGTTFVQGKIGKARDFDGSDDYIACSDASCGGIGKLDFGLTDSMTLDGWVKVESGTTTWTMASKLDVTGPGYRITSVTSNVVFYFYATDQTTTVTVSRNLADDQWHYLAGVRDVGADKIYLYIDGQLAGSATDNNTDSSNSASQFEIGQSQSARRMNGLIDEVRVSDTARTADQIRQAYEVGRRTHPITIDFNASLDSSNLLSCTSTSDCSGDLSFSLTDGGKIKGEAGRVVKGDKVIIRENYGGTEYIAQGTVTAVTYASGASNPNAPNQDQPDQTSVTSVTVGSWDSGSSFPDQSGSYGFTANATVFKWQREIFDLTPIITEHRDGLSRITLRVTDGSEGRTFWLDDFKSADYMGGASGGAGAEDRQAATINSTVNRYFQYRAILTSRHPELVSGSDSGSGSGMTPSLERVQIMYDSGNIPQSQATDDTGRPADANTVVMLKMDDNVSGDAQTLKDASAKGNDGTTEWGANAAGMDCTVTGKVGSGACEFDGTDDYVSVSDNASLDVTTFTLEAWVNPDGADEHGYMIAKYDDTTTGGYALAWFGGSDQLALYTVVSGAPTYVTSNAVFVDSGVWVHIAVTNNAGSVTFYRNGVAAGTATRAVTANNVNLYLGNRVGGTAASHYFDGQIDEVHISNVARTAAEIQQNAQPRPSSFGGGTFNRITDSGSTSSPQLELAYHELPADEHTVGLWHVNETANDTCSGGQDACDSSGNGNHGTATGTTIDTTNQKLGAAARSFNGTSDYVQSSANIGLTGTASKTLEAWVKFSAADLVADKIAVPAGWGWTAPDTGDPASGGGFAIASYGWGGAGKWAMWGTGGSAYDVVSNTTLSAGVWYHLAATYDGTTVRLYTNGVYDGSSTVTLATVASLLYFGRKLGTPTDRLWFSGTVDEVRISNRALTPEEIKANASRHPYGVYTSEVMNLGSNVSSIDNLRWTENGVQTGDGETPYSTDSLVAQWNFNETSGTVAANGAPTGSCGGTASDCNGTVTSMTTTGQDDAAGDGWTKDNGKWPGSSPAALAFDGTDGYVINSGGTMLDTMPSAISIETWIKPDTTANGTIAMKMNDRTASSFDYLEFYFKSTGKINWDVYSNHTNYGVTSNQSYTPGQWHYVVAIAGSSGVKLYINGALDNSNSNTQMPSDASGSGCDFILGESNGDASCGLTGGYYFNGTMDSTRIYNRTLTADEILANYQAGNIEFQTRTGSTSSPPSGWEAWKPASAEGAETQLDDLDDGQYDTTDPNMVAYWKMDEANWGTPDCSAAVLSDSSQNSNTGKACPATTGPDGGDTGRFGNGVEFDGSDDYVQVTDAATLKPSNITIEAWIKADPVGAVENAIVSKYVGTSPFNGYALWLKSSGGNSVLAFWVGNNSSWLLGNKVLDDGNWHHVAGTNDGTTSRIYVDGREENSAAKTENLSGAIDLFIGKIASGSSDYFNGTIDEVAIYNDARTAAEIARDAYWSPDKTNNTVAGGVYTEQDTSTKYEGSGSEKITLGAPQVDANTVALWHLEETNGDLAGDDVFDETANNNDGELNGTAPGPEPVDGIFGKARDFNGSDDYVRVPDSASLDITGALTISAWAFLKDTVADYRAIAGRIFDGVTFDPSYWIEIHSGGQACATIHDGAYRVVYDTVAFSLNTWHFVAATYNGTTLRLYVDGIEKDSVASGNPEATNAPLTIGKWEGDDPNPFNGLIDEVRISNTARTAEEIAEAYRAGRDHRVTRGFVATDLSSKTKLPFWIASDRPGTFLEATVGESAYANYEPDANTVGLWHLEEKSGSGAYIKDSSSQGIDLTPAGTVTFVQGKIGKARQSDGASGSKLTGTTNTTWDNLGSTGDFTIDTWAKYTGTAENLLMRGEAVNGPYIFMYQTSALTCTVYNTAHSAVSATTSVNDGNWHHIACVRKNSGTTMEIYIDGKLDNTATVTARNVGTTKTLWLENDGITGGYHGTMDEVRISNSARTADYIRQAYEVGRRTHPITIDFATTPSSAYSSGTSLSLTNPSDVPLADVLHVGDTLIIKENTAGTVNTEQKVVTAINGTTVTIASAFSNTYTTNATVFKWQREWFEIPKQVRDDDKDAISRITLRVTDGSEGRTFWIDDFKTAGPYLTDSTTRTATVTSTPQQFFQYRVIFTVSPRHPELVSGSISPSLTAVSVQYHHDPHGSVLGADILTSAGSYDKDGNLHLGDDNVNDVAFYDRAQRDSSPAERGGRTRDDFSYALDFDGSNDYVSVADTTDLDFTDTEDTTISGWFSRGTYTTDDVIICKRNDLETGQGYCLYIDDANDNLVFEITDDTPDSYKLTSATTFTDSNWYHFTVVWDQDSAANSEIYINGVDDDATDTGTIGNIGDASNAIVFAIGAESDAGNPFDGIVDEVAVFNDARTAAEIEEHYNSRRIDPNDSDIEEYVVGLWHFDEGSGTRAYDTSGKKNHGTLTNMTDDDWVNSLSDKDKHTFSTDSNWNSFALETDGSNDYVDIGTGPTSVKTVEFWVYPETTTEYFVNITATTDYIWANSGTVTATGFSSPTIYVDGVATATITADAWHHVAVVTSTAENASNLDIGRTADTSYLEGKIDEVRLSGNERYSSGFTASRRFTTDANTGALYHFDEGTGTKAADDSAGRNDGTLTNMDENDWVQNPSHAEYHQLATQSVGVDPNWAEGVARESWGLEFVPGDSDYVKPSTSLYSGSNSAYTVDAWFKTTSSTANIIIHHGRPWGLMQVNRTGGANKLACLGATTPAFSTTTINDGNWHHGACTHNGSTVKVYVDGVYENQASDTITSGTSVGTIGAAEDDPPGSGFFDGVIDELRLSPIIRYNSNFTPPRRFVEDSDTAALFHFDEGADNTCSGGQDVCDSSKNGYHGTSTNSPAWVSGAKAVMATGSENIKLSSASSTASDLGYEVRVSEDWGLDFESGESDYIVVANESTFDLTTAVTLDAWIKPESLSAEQDVVSKDNAYAINFVTDFDSPKMYLWAAGNCTAGENLSTGTWYHIAGTFDGTDIKIFVNGVLSNKCTASAGSLTDDSASVHIGTQVGASWPFDGVIDEIRISSVDRYGGSCSTVGQQCFTPERRFEDDSSTIGLWHFDEGTTDTCTTQSGGNDICDDTSVSERTANPGAFTNTPAYTKDDSGYIGVTDEVGFQWRDARSASGGWRNVRPTAGSTARDDCDSDGTNDGIELKEDDGTGTGVCITFVENPTPANSHPELVSGSSGRQGQAVRWSQHDRFLIPSWAVEAFSSSDGDNAMRGKRNSFPDQSYLVATDKGLDILDARDNTLWMRLEQGYGHALGDDTNNDPSSIFMHHGQLYTGTNGSSATGLYRFDFGTDTIYRYNSTNRSKSDQSIAKRNTSDHSYSADVTQPVQSTTINDVWGTVIQNKVEIAVATGTTGTSDGAATILHDETGAVSAVDFIRDDQDGSDIKIRGIFILPDGTVYAAYGIIDNERYLYAYYNIQNDTSDEGSLGANGDKYYVVESTPALLGDTNSYITNVFATVDTSTVDSTSNTIYVANESGLTVIQEKQGDETNGSVKYYTAPSAIGGVDGYITEEMIGDVRGMLPLQGTGELAVNTTISNADASVKANAFTSVGSGTVPDYVTGVRGTSLDFDGGDYICTGTGGTCANDTDLDFSTGTFSYGLWLKTTMSGVEKGFLNKVDLSNGNQGWGLQISSATNVAMTHFRSIPEQNCVAQSTTAINTGDWFHIVVVKDTATSAKIYVNGVEEGTCSNASLATISNTQPFEVGRFNSNQYATATLDEVFVTAEVLTATQIAQLYIAGKEALENRERAKKSGTEKDAMSELYGASDVVKAIGAVKENQTGVSRASELWVGTNGSSADDGALSRIWAMGDIRVGQYDESQTEPFLVDNDISSIAVSSDGAFVIVGTDDAGITVIQQGSGTTRLRHGKHYQSGRERQMRAD